MIVGRASLTSLGVVFGVLLLGGEQAGRTRLPKGLYETQVDLMRACGLPFGQVPWLISNKLTAVPARWVGRMVKTDLMTSLGYRKAWMEEQVRRAIHDKHQPAGAKNNNREQESEESCRDDEWQQYVASGSAEQVLIVGAGYDTLALRMSREYPNLHFWEVDHPDTARVKRKGLDALKAPANLHTFAIDLTDKRLSDSLPSMDGYSPEKTTVVVVEGLTYYLRERDVKALFSDLAKVVGPQSLVAFDFLDRQSGTGDPELSQWVLFNKAILGAVSTVGEPLYWSCYPKDLPSFFSSVSNGCWKLVTPVKAAGFERMATVKLMGDDATVEQ